MALTNPVLSDLISHGCQLADQLLAMRGLLDEINVLYDGVAGFKTAITPEEEAEIAATFYGLTKQQLDDGLYVLTAMIKADLTNGLNQLIQLAARG